MILGGGAALPSFSPAEDSVISQVAFMFCMVKLFTN